MRTDEMWLKAGVGTVRSRLAAKSRIWRLRRARNASGATVWMRFRSR